jgi:hypothetical protein
MTEERRFGTPPHSLEEWLRIFIADCQVARRQSLNPWRRMQLRHRIAGMESALHLIRQRDQQSSLPVTIPPGGAVEFVIPITVK